MNGYESVPRRKENKGAVYNKEFISQPENEITKQETLKNYNNERGKLNKTEIILVEKLTKKRVLQ